RPRGAARGPARGLPEPALAALPVPAAAERAGLRAERRAAAPGRARSALGVQQHGTRRSGGAAREARREVPATRAETRRVDGGGRTPGPGGLRVARAASPAPAYDQCPRTAQPRAASAHARRDAVPQRGFAPPPRLGDGRRDQRGVGDRTHLLEPGERVRTPAQPAL